MPCFGGAEAGDYADESVEVEDREVSGAGEDDDYDEKGVGGNLSFVLRRDCGGGRGGEVS